ncbi:MAG: tetratricopeptide repeat protein [Alphaproteobacteria bacterium]|nr:tetratricopeptide repeat protein [Alphaproteobacteria bacterium]
MRSIVTALVFACAFLAPSAHAQMGSMAPSAPRQDPAVPYQAGVAAFNAGNYPEAIRQLRTARRASPSDGTINYALGLAYNANGEKEEAKTAFERAVRASNAPAAAHLQLGLVALQLGDRDTAVEQQTALQRSINACDAACGDARRGQMQSSLDQLTRALATP